MLKKIHTPQLEMFKTVLTSFINPEHELCLIAKKWIRTTLKKYLLPCTELLQTTVDPKTNDRWIITAKADVKPRR